MITIFDLALGSSRQVSHSLIARGLKLSFSSDQSYPSPWLISILLVNPSDAPHVKSHQRKILTFFTPSCQDSGKILISQMKNPFSRRSPSRVRPRPKRVRPLLIVRLQRPQTMFVLPVHAIWTQNPKDYHLLGFRFNNLLYFDTRCPFGLKTSAMICQRTTKAVVHCFTQLGFLADVYLDDFYGADSPARASTAFTSLRQLLQELGLQTSPDKDSPPSTKLVCLGINVDSEEMSLSVPPFRVQELSQELSLWSQRSRYTKKQLQSLLGKLSFVTACVKPGRIFMARLLNNLRSLSKSRSSHPISEDMRADISWWSSFLPLFNGVSLIKASSGDFSDFHFATDASLTGGGAICLDECFHFQFSSDILRRASHISSLELYTIVVAVRLWATKLRHRKFIVSCDNQAAVIVINSGSTKDQFMQRCLRQLWFSAAVFDFELLARHIPGEHNVLADALSRWDSDPSLHAIFQTSARSLNRVYTFQQVSPACLLFQIQ